MWRRWQSLLDLWGVSIRCMFTSACRQPWPCHDLWHWKEKHNYQTILFGCISISIWDNYWSFHQSTDLLNHCTMRITLCYSVCYGNYLNDLAQFISYQNANAFQFWPATEQISLLQTWPQIIDYLSEHSLINIHELRLNCVVTTQQPQSIKSTWNIHKLLYFYIIYNMQGWEFN